MATVRINVERYKGEYPLESDRPMNALEWRWIKKIAGYMPLTIDNGFAGEDPDLYLALAVIAMNRAGKVRNEEVMLAARVLEVAPVDGASIVIDFTEDDIDESTEDGEAGPEA